MSVETKERRVKGVSLCQGIALGNAFIFRVDCGTIPEFTIFKEDISDEIARFKSALERKDLKTLERPFETP